MPARIPTIDRIVEAVGISVGPDSRCRWIEPIGRQEPAEHGIEVPGVQVLQAGFGVELFADVDLGLAEGRELLAEGQVVGALGPRSRRVGDQAHGGEVVAVHPRRDGADALGLGGEVLGLDTAVGALEVVAQVERGGRAGGLDQPRTVGAVGVDHARNAGRSVLLPQ
jgi:hypothetical protein